MGIQSKRFAILGDKGINDKVGQGFWDEVVDKMMSRFKEDRFAEGITEAIQLTGEKLKGYFPFHRDDMNELPDEISYSL